MDQEPEWEVRSGADGQVVLAAQGPWTIGAVAGLDRRIKATQLNGARHAIFDISGITRLDTAGAWLLYRTRRDFSADGVEVTFSGLDAQYAPLLDLVEQADLAHPEIDRERPNALTVLFGSVGKAVCEAGEEAVSLLNFLD